MKRFFAILLTLALMFSLAACGGGDEDKTQSNSNTPPSNTTDPGTSQTENEKSPEETADEIASGFGSYDGQSIVWRVLDIDLVNERALLISSDCIDKVLFHETEPTEELTWESSDLRKWLGDEFYDMAFTEEQKGKILEVTNPADTNNESGAQGGNDTTDKVFILSASEMVKYFVDDADMAGTLNGEDISYWTRTPGDNTQGYVCTYSGGGGLYMTGNWATSTEVAVRPAIWVSLSDKVDTAVSSGSTDPGTSELNEKTSTTDNGQAQQTIDEYVAALSEYVKSRHSNAIIYYDETYMMGELGYPVLVVCEQSDGDADGCTVYWYMGHFNRDTAYDKSKTAESVGPNGDVNANKVIERNDGLKCYSYLYGNSSWDNIESQASGCTIIQERGQ